MSDSERGVPVPRPGERGAGGAGQTRSSHTGSVAHSVWKKLGTRALYPQRRKILKMLLNEYSVYFSKPSFVSLLLVSDVLCRP